MQACQLLVEARVGLCLRPGRGQFIESRDQRLRNVAAPIGAETTLYQLSHAVAGLAERTASKNAASKPWSLRPGSASTPLATSTANGRAVATAFATLSGRKPPATSIGIDESRWARRSQSKVSPVPPQRFGRRVSKRWKSVLKASAP